MTSHNSKWHLHFLELHISIGIIENVVLKEIEDILVLEPNDFKVFARVEHAFDGVAPLVFVIKFLEIRWLVAKVVVEVPIKNNVVILNHDVADLEDCLLTKSMEC